MDKTALVVSIIALITSISSLIGCIWFEIRMSNRDMRERRERFNEQRKRGASRIDREKSLEVK
jgi:hypothetical protein